MVKHFGKGFHTNKNVKPKIMKFTFSVGCDVGKEKLFLCIVDVHGKCIYEVNIKNKDEAITAFIKQLKKRLELIDLAPVLLCMEHTGIYKNKLLRIWLSQAGQVSVVAAQKIASSLAGDQGWDEKNDWLDARRIAEYSIRFADKLKLYRLKQVSLRKLEHLQRQRERIIKVLHILEVPIKEANGFLDVRILDSMSINQEVSIKALKEDLKKIEKQLQNIIEQDEKLYKLFNQICSVAGVGPVTAREVLIATHGFTKFNPKQAKAFARYAGVVPRDWSSGKSVRKRKINNNRINQRLKNLLTMGALSAAVASGELAIYYQRKRAEGKAHLSVINAIRNKIILRVFAVVRNQVTYDKNFNFCLD